MAVGLNIDLGELSDEPPELYAIATAVNVACGGHAGDARTMKRAVELAAKHGCQVVAHPSYADIEGFGRSARFSEPAETKRAVRAQCAQLRAIADKSGVRVRSVKPHGALYHDASGDADYAAALIEGALAGLGELESIVGFPDTALEDIVRARSFRYVREGFADRRYDQDWKLVPRTSDGALLTEPESCVTQALLLARMARVDTLCIHGDTAGAVAIGRAVRQALESEGLLDCP